MGKSKWIFLMIAMLMFLGCSGIEPSPSFYNISINSSNKRAYFKHYSILPPEIKQNELDQWKFIRSQTTDAFTFHLKRMHDGVMWLSYGVEITPRNAENYKVRLGLFDKERTLGFHDTALKTIEAIKNKDQEYLKKYANTEGFKSARYTTVNHYPAIEMEMYTKYREWNEYEKKYYLYSYTKTGKLKQYQIKIYAHLANPDNASLKDQYSFQDMLQRAKRSLDSFTPSDEDFGPDEVSG